LGQDGLMTAVRYPVAQTAEAALSAPLARAARASEAEAVVGGGVEFVSEAAGRPFRAARPRLTPMPGAWTTSGRRTG